MMKHDPLWQEMKLMYFGVGAIKNWFITIVVTGSVLAEVAFVMVLG